MANLMPRTLIGLCARMLITSPADLQECKWMTTFASQPARNVEDAHLAARSCPVERGFAKHQLSIRQAQAAELFGQPVVLMNGHIPPPCRVIALTRKTVPM